METRAERMTESPPREQESMDMLYLLERLEEVLNAGSALPFTRRTLVDDEECFAIIDQIRLSLPNEIRQARKLNSDRDALLTEAQTRAEQIIRSAEDDARDLARDHHVARQAEARAAELIAQADKRAEETRLQADDYAYRVLADLERRLDGLSSTVRNGLLSLRPDEIDEDHRDIESPPR
ncbi:MAG: H+ATpase subunit [Chloroflexi bacterium]|nr:H+ATpase subunit [Chloroflexota bacterium]